ncbi:threonine/homoserine efflux transporter RhtA [Bacillus oleivorans]|uniref:Threonine/homoserine efflux transporter RhtA n=1 Tax=Bacillus oleivorans TaxID=1448271 RepID=A0A285CHQ5_9BACI|nr:DMT family transporter [Bacillus oleivorans]SNX67132.1 threonine/homoserine efflux transporter RhtA [Bacillus oleivorans]
MRLYLALITLSLIWGMSFYFIKVLVEGLGPWGIVFVRSALGALTLAAILLIQRKKIAWKSIPLKSLVLVGCMNALIPWGLIGISETRISSALASMVNATTPIFTSVLGVILFSVALSARQWTGILIGFVGILFLIDLDITQLFQEDLIGMGTMLAATVCYGFSSQYTKRHLQGVSVMAIALMTLLTSSLGSLVMMAVTDSFFPLHQTIDWNTIFAMVGLGVFGSGLAYLLFYYMIQAGSAEFATFVTYLVPITAMFWGWFLLDEQIPPLAIGGLALILAGVFLSTRKTAKKVHAGDHAVSSAK